MAVVHAVSKDSTHQFSKQTVDEIFLIAGEGVDGDAHRGVTVKHRSRVRADPTQPNLRQVHLIHLELLEALQTQGFRVAPATMGENITTMGLDLLALPTATILHIGPEAQIQITGLRNPCKQLDDYQPGLMAAVLDHDDQGNLIRKAGVMAIVWQGGVVRKGDAIAVHFPPAPHRPLAPV